MHFQRLRLSGFKSFVEPTEFRIEPGLTGVVGPERLRQVQHARSAALGDGGQLGQGHARRRHGRRDLRRHRRAALAQPCRGDADDRQRRPHRAGARSTTIPSSRWCAASTGAQGSTYRINGAEVRARDVQLLFADASTGANSPALVRQGQISELIAAKPAEPAARSGRGRRRIGAAWPPARSGTAAARRRGQSRAAGRRRRRAGGRPRAPAARGAPGREYKRWPPRSARLRRALLCVRWAERRDAWSASPPRPPPWRGAETRRARPPRAPPTRRGRRGGRVGPLATRSRRRRRAAPAGHRERPAGTGGGQARPRWSG